MAKSKTDVVNSSVARLLREKRKELGLSMYIVAKRAQVSHSTMIRIENELRNPSLDVLIRITNAMGIDLWPVIKEAERKAVKK